MPQPVNDFGNTNAPLSINLFFGVIFAGITISFLALAFRLSVRWKLFKAIFWDDILIIFAWILFFVPAIVTWFYREAVYIIYFLLNSIDAWTEHNIQLAIVALRLSVAAVLVYFTSLWLIKLSILIFFRRLGVTKRSQRIWWWFVTTFTVLSYFPLIGAIPYECVSADLFVLINKCYGAEANRRKDIVFYYHLAVDIITDALIVSIPVIMLWNIQMPRKQKLGLMALFSMTLLVIACAIVRIAINVGVNGDGTWILFWSYIELTISIIIACGVSFRQMFKRSSSGGSSKTTTKSKTNISTKSTVSISRQDQFKRGNVLDSPRNYRTPDPYGGFDEEDYMPEEPKRAFISDATELQQSGIPLNQMKQSHVVSQPVTPIEHRDIFVRSHNPSESQQRLVNFDFVQASAPFSTKKDLMTPI